MVGSKRWMLVALAAVFLAWTGCADDAEESSAPDGLPQSDTTVMGGADKSDSLVEEEYPETFDEFLDYVYCESDGRVCVVDGDTPIPGTWPALREFYDRHVDVDADDDIDSHQQGLSVNRGDRGDDLWYGQQRHNLSFCISDEFGDDHERVEEATVGAARDWEEIADVTFPYRDDQNHRCDRDNEQVFFPVMPAEEEASYFARAFFPTPIVSGDDEDDEEDEDGEEQGDDEETDEEAEEDEEPPRDVRVNVDAIEGSFNDVSMRGIQRHELGHVLGFRHEHTRKDEDYWCFEDHNYRPGTEYDTTSVMHYPQCDGDTDWTLPFSEYDEQGAQYFYPEDGVEVLGRCDDEINDDGTVREDCEAVAEQIVDWLSQYGDEEVLVDWMGLDEETAEPIADERMEEPFEDFDDLRERAEMSDDDIRATYDYLFEWGRCPGAELDEDDWVQPSCYPVVNGILELANNASASELDEVVGLDRRAVENIVTAREQREIDTYDGLTSLGYVKQQALYKMYDHLYEQH